MPKGKIRNHNILHNQEYLDGHPVDTGCEVSSSCLACPLAECIFDNPILMSTYKRIKRWKRIYDNTLNLTPQQAAEQEGITVRTFFRILAGYKKGELN